MIHLAKLTKEQKIATYGCDGKCYWDKGMCPRVEICPETRNKEFVATIVACISVLLLTIISLPITIPCAIYDKIQSKKKESLKDNER